VLNFDELPGGPWEVEDEKAWPPRRFVADGRILSPPLEAPGSSFAWRTFHCIGTLGDALSIRVTPFETSEEAMDELSRFPGRWKGSVAETGIDWHSRVDHSSNGIVFRRSIPSDACVPSCQGAVESVLFEIGSVVVYGESEPDWDLLLTAAAAQVQKIRRILAEDT